MLNVHNEAMKKAHDSNEQRLNRDHALRKLTNTSKRTHKKKKKKYSRAMKRRHTRRNVHEKKEERKNKIEEEMKI